jgi:cyanuric acid amidohydrolase
MRVSAFRVPTASPGDVSGLAALLDSGSLRADEVVAIVGKTEGNGGRNDFSRELAGRALEDLFAARLGVPREEVGERIVFSLSGGCEGVASPHLVVLARGGEPLEERRPVKRLALGIGFTRDLRSEEIGRRAQIDETAAAIRRVVTWLRVDSPADVHLVQMKGAIPGFTYAEARAAELAGRPLRSDMAFSRGASALGAALALGEIDPERLTDDAVCRDFFSLYSRVASCSAKPGLARTEIIVLANSAYWDGDLAIGHGVLVDMLDVRSIHAVLTSLGLPPDGQLTPEQAERVIGVFAKSEADPRGTIRGLRHTMLTDDDISDTRYSRGLLAAVLASVVGHGAVYVSTRAEHHGPLGGGTLAVVARLPEGAEVP